MIEKERKRTMKPGSGSHKSASTEPRPRPERASALEIAVAHHRAGRLRQAEQLYQHLLEVQPDNSDALHLLGILCAQSGDNLRAADLIEKAIGISPTNAAFHFNLANVYRVLGRLPDAIAAYRRALAIDPNHHEAHNNLGATLQEMGDLDEAVSVYQRALAIDPKFAAAHSNLGNTLRALGKPDEAVACHRRALAIDPNDAEAHFNLGNALKDHGKLDEAAAAYRRAIAINPDHDEAHYNLGNTLRALGKLEEAAGSYQRALAINPKFAAAHTNLGNALHAQGKFDEAEASLRRAVALSPDFAIAHSNLGILLKDLGRYDEAEESLDRALRLDPDCAPAKDNLAFLLLVVGDFGRAWEYYSASQFVRDGPRVLWQKPLPKKLHNKRMFVRRDQGLGDEIFFLRFAPELRKRGAEITYLADAKIASIIARLPFIDRVGRVDKRLEGVDIAVSVTDLPYLLEMKSAENIPPPLRLSPEPERVERLDVKLKNLGPAPYIGVTWRAGTPNNPGRVFRAAPLEELGHALSGVAGTLLALQRMPEAGEIEALKKKLGRPVHDFTALNEDLEDMLALLALMDEYVTVSNTNVHLRAGTGRTSRILIPNPPQYWWMAEGAESPWFPGCKLYRQKVDGSWEEALAALARDLAKAFNG